MADKKKPNVEEVFAAFQTFQNCQLQITRMHPVGQWAAKMAEQREIFKAQLDQLGLAEHIDWTPPGGG